MDDPKRRLKGMLVRIFSDAVVEESERGEFLDFLSEGLLSQEERAEVVAQFVATTWKTTIADGVVSEREKLRLKRIVEMLALEPASLPAEWARIVAE